MATPTPNADDVLVDCRSVWKVFGNRAPEAMRAIGERGLGKTEVLKEFGCVVGVSDATLQVRRGEIFCIMGLSGSGKSTLIRMLNRLIEPSGGQVFVKGRDIGKLGATELRELRARHIAMVFQSVALLPHRTVLENAAFGLEVQGIAKTDRNRTAEAALTKVGLGDWLQRYPGELSGGMQQRVGLARAFATGAPILLMDEPFSALDPLIRNRLQDELLMLQDKMHCTIVFVSHDLEEAVKLGNTITIMEGGRIVQTGAPEDIVLRPANGYVADFVAHLNPLSVLTATDAMVADAGPAVAERSLTPGAPLKEALPFFAASPDPVWVVEDGATVGKITSRSVYTLLARESAGAPEGTAA